jgi:hypothetical protein
MLAWLFSDCFERMPGLKTALSEGNIGWMPYFIERAEQVIDKQRHWAKQTSTAFYNSDVETKQVMANLDTLNVRETIRNHVFGCFIEESSGLRSLDIIGEDNVMVETDYPHSDTTWPDSIGVARKILDDADLPADTQYKILRGNAEKLFRFTPAVPTRA